jgi:hypothetical protein
MAYTQCDPRLKFTHRIARHNGVFKSTALPRQRSQPASQSSGSRFGTSLIRIADPARAIVS